MYPQKVKNLVFLVEKLRKQQNNYFCSRHSLQQAYHQEISEPLEHKIDELLQEILNDIANG